jgi:hypothetical protein
MDRLAKKARLLAVVHPRLQLSNDRFSQKIINW